MANYHINPGVNQDRKPTPNPLSNQNRLDEIILKTENKLKKKSEELNKTVSDIQVRAESFTKQTMDRQKTKKAFDKLKSNSTEYKTLSNEVEILKRDLEELKKLVGKPFKEQSQKIQEFLENAKFNESIKGIQFTEDEEASINQMLSPQPSPKKRKRLKKDTMGQTQPFTGAPHPQAAMWPPQPFTGAPHPQAVMGLPQPFMGTPQTQAVMRPTQPGANNGFWGWQPQTQAVMRPTQPFKRPRHTQAVMGPPQTFMGTPQTQAAMGPPHHITQPTPTYIIQPPFSRWGASELEVLENITKQMIITKTFDEKLKILSQFIPWQQYVTKIPTTPPIIRYWSWLMLYKNIKNLIDMCFSRNKEDKSIRITSQIDLNKLTQLINEPSIIGKKTPGGIPLILYIINGVRENETINFRKFFADQSGGKAIFNQLLRDQHQLKESHTKEQKKKITLYIQSDQTKAFLKLLQTHSSDKAHAIPWVNHIKQELLNVKNLLNPKPLTLQKNTVSKCAFTKKDPIDTRKSEKIWEELQSKGILKDGGIISDQIKMDEAFKLTLAAHSNLHQHHVLTILQQAKATHQMVSKHAFLKKSDLDQHQSETIWIELNKVGILAKDGTITLKNDQKIDKTLNLNLSPSNQLHMDHILKVLNEKNTMTQVLD